ncbi:hypothetical protein ABB02_00744 [Clostridiaceae bacterium JG1575]|nr:hypothetical protein ABB02_00744 [Clostridiaceae bacterium JG1575]
MILAESGEMYLETILVLSQKRSEVRSVDVSESMGVTKPSVSRAIGLLKESGFVETDEHGFLHLTASGLTTAQKIYDRHRLLTEFLIHLGVSPETAAKDACKMEHDISDETVHVIRGHLYPEEEDLP